MLASGAQQEQLIEALLTLARGQAGLDKQEPFDLTALTRQVLAARGSEAEHRNLTLHADLRPARAAGSWQLAERLAANLIDNALRHNVPGGRIDVTTGTRNSRAVLCVANTGTAIPAAAVDRLFQPFQRLGTDRTSRGEGTGLGLSIVQAIADAHSASITARPQPGGGMLVEVTFPDPRTASPAPAAPGNPHARITAATCKPRLAEHAGPPKRTEVWNYFAAGFLRYGDRTPTRASSPGNQKPRDAISKDSTTDKPEHWP